jgi:twitching motility protein PilT
MARIDALFNLMFEQKASDLHLSSGNPPILRINGELTRVDYPPLEDDQLKIMLYEIAPEYKIKTFEETGDVDFGYEITGVSRFRANFFTQKYGIAAVFRQIPSKVLSFEDFEKFDAPASGAQEICHAAQGVGGGDGADRLRQIHHAGGHH